MVSKEKSGPLFAPTLWNIQKIIVGKYSLNICLVTFLLSFRWINEHHGYVRVINATGQLVTCKKS